MKIILKIVNVMALMLCLGGMIGSPLQCAIPGSTRRLPTPRQSIGQKLTTLRDKLKDLKNNLSGLRTKLDDLKGELSEKENKTSDESKTISDLIDELRSLPNEERTGTIQFMTLETITKLKNALPPGTQDVLEEIDKEITFKNNHMNLGINTWREIFSQLADAAKINDTYKKGLSIIRINNTTYQQFIDGNQPLPNVAKAQLNIIPISKLLWLIKAVIFDNQTTTTTSINDLQNSIINAWWTRTKECIIHKENLADKKNGLKQVIELVHENRLKIKDRVAFFPNLNTEVQEILKQITDPQSAKEIAQFGLDTLVEIEKIKLSM